MQNLLAPRSLFQFFGSLSQRTAQNDRRCRMVVHRPFFVVVFKCIPISRQGSTANGFDSLATLTHGGQVKRRTVFARPIRIHFSGPKRKQKQWSSGAYVSPLKLNDETTAQAAHGRGVTFYLKSPPMDTDPRVSTACAMVAVRCPSALYAKSANCTAYCCCCYCCSSTHAKEFRIIIAPFAKGNWTRSRFSAGSVVPMHLFATHEMMKHR